MKVGNVEPSTSMHAPCMASLCVGKTCGVAPEASLYFMGSTNADFTKTSFTINCTYYAKALDEIIAINKSLPEDQKIRAVSISASWCPEHKGYKEITEAIERAKKEGIFIVSCNLFEDYGFWTYCLDKEPLTDPDNPEFYMIFDWESSMKMVDHIPGFVNYYEENFKRTIKEKCY